MPPPDDAQIAGQDARQAAAYVWSNVGRPDAQVTDEHYIWLHDSFTAHLSVRFGERLEDCEVAAIVRVGLLTFLPPLYVRHMGSAAPSPEDVLRHLDDLALDRITRTELSPQLVPAEQSDDRAVVSDVFGDDVDVAGYCEVLHLLRRTGQRDEYLVITQYMALCELTGTPPSFAEVAAALGRPSITEKRAQQLTLRFAGRLPRNVSHE